MMRFKPKAICAFLTYIMSTSAFAANGIDFFNIIDKPKRYEFEHVVLFGDSLTDAGSAPDHRFVAGGYDYPGYFDALSNILLANEPFLISLAVQITPLLLPMLLPFVIKYAIILKITTVN